MEQMMYIRPDRGDTDRTRLLKEVLRSTQGVMRESHGPAVGWRLSLGDTDRPRDRPKEVERTGRLGSSHTGAAAGDALLLDALLPQPLALASAEPAAGMPGGTELAPVLRVCDQRIGGLCARLAAAQAQLPRRTSPRPRDDSDGICIVDCPDVSPSITRLRVEQATANYISRHARYRELEELEAAIEKSAGYEDLRKVVPRRFRHHPSLQHLSDVTMQDQGAFQLAIWTPGSVKEDGLPKGRLPSSLRPQRTGLSTADMEGSAALRGLAAPGKLGLGKARVRISRDYSAPCF